MCIHPTSQRRTETSAGFPLNPFLLYFFVGVYKQLLIAFVQGRRACMQQHLRCIRTSASPSAAASESVASVSLSASLCCKVSAGEELLKAPLLLSEREAAAAVAGAAPPATVGVSLPLLLLPAGEEGVVCSVYSAAREAAVAAADDDNEPGAAAADAAAEAAVEFKEVFVDSHSEREFSALPGEESGGCCCC